MRPLKREAKMATKKRVPKVIKLFDELFEIEQKLKETKALYERKEELLAEIFEKQPKKPHVIFSEYDSNHYEVQVVEQNGHYVFHKPYRLSLKKKK